jgi:hypothetical protein
VVTRGGTKTSPHSGYAQLRPAIIGATPTHRISSPVSRRTTPRCRRDRDKNSAFLAAAVLGAPPSRHRSLLALNGLRVPEATGADIEHLGLEQGNRTLVIMPKGRVVTSPLARAPPGDRPGGPRAHRRAGSACLTPLARRTPHPGCCPPRVNRRHARTAVMRGIWHRAGSPVVRAVWHDLRASAVFHQASRRAKSAGMYLGSLSGPHRARLGQVPVRHSLGPGDG